MVFEKLIQTLILATLCTALSSHAQVVPESVSLGSSSACGVTTAGGVKCWGGFALGDGTTNIRAQPAYVQGLRKGVKSVSVGGNHACALMANGTVKCWGYNASGQLGDGTTTTYRNTPVDVIGLGSAVISISAGNGYSCAVVVSGAVKCWGSNLAGKLGLGHVSDFDDPPVLTPSFVLGIDSPMQSVSAGYMHTCALATNGAAKCWGENSYGQLGRGFSGEHASVAGTVLGLVGSLTQLWVGDSFTCALNSAGAVQCWGLNHKGQLGRGTINVGPNATPMSVLGLNASVIKLAVGGDFACAIQAGVLKCWGGDDYGQSADGVSDLGRADPHPAADASLVFQSVFAGANALSACGLRGAQQDLYCWGRDQTGQLGDRYVGSFFPYARKIASTQSGVIKLAVGANHACLQNATNQMKCWGDNSWQQLGKSNGLASPFDGEVNPQDAGSPLMGIPNMLALGDINSCVLNSVNQVFCWGSNVYGLLGQDPAQLSQSRLPLLVSGFSGILSKLSIGNSHACVLSYSQTIYCWGYNGDGQLGNGTSGTTQFVPTEVQGILGPVAELSTNGRNTCARLVDGRVQCWGDNGFGQLGLDPSVMPRSTTATLVTNISDARALAMGAYHACVTTNLGAVRCWGYNGYGQLGVSQNTNGIVDVPGMGSGVTALTAGYHHTCAIRFDQVWCWGMNEDGQTGRGSFRNGAQASPATVFGMASNVLTVSSKGNFTCALSALSEVFCWGNDDYGQLGDGKYENAWPKMAYPHPRNGIPLITGIATSGSVTEGSVFSIHSQVINTDASWGDVLTAFDYDCRNDGVFEYLSMSSAQWPTCSFLDEGSYPIRVRVWDNFVAAEQAPGDETINFSVANVAPTINSFTGPASVALNSRGSAVVIFQFAATDPGVLDVLEYQLDCDNNGSFELRPTTSLSASCTFSSIGIKTVRLKVTDGDGGETISSRSVAVKAS